MTAEARRRFEEHPLYELVRALALRAAREDHAASTAAAAARLGVEAMDSDAPADRTIAP